MVFLTAAAVIVVGQWAVYDLTPVSQQNRLRSLVAAAVLGLAGVRILLTPEQDHELSVRFSLLTAAALLFFAVMAPHDSRAALLSEGLCGAATLLAAMVALPPADAPRR